MKAPTLTLCLTSWRPHAFKIDNCWTLWRNQSFYCIFFPFHTQKGNGTGDVFAASLSQNQAASIHSSDYPATPPPSTPPEYKRGAVNIIEHGGVCSFLISLLPSESCFSLRVRSMPQTVRYSPLHRRSECACWIYEEISSDDRARLWKVSLVLPREVCRRAGRLIRQTGLRQTKTDSEGLSSETGRTKALETKAIWIMGGVDMTWVFPHPLSKQEWNDWVKEG